MTKPKTASKLVPAKPAKAEPASTSRPRRRSPDKALTTNVSASRTNKSSKPSKALASKPAPVEATNTSKRDRLAALLLRDQGATLDQMIALTGWLPHTTRAALSGLRKKGYAIDSDKIDGIRTYRAVAPK